MDLFTKVCSRRGLRTRRGALHLVRAMNGGNDADGKSEINARRSSSTKGKISVSKLLLNTDKHRQLKKIERPRGREAPHEHFCGRKTSKGDRPFTLPPGNLSRSSH